MIKVNGFWLFGRFFRVTDTKIDKSVTVSYRKVRDILLDKPGAWQGFFNINDCWQSLFKATNGVIHENVSMSELHYNKAAERMISDIYEYACECSILSIPL